ncbi:MAG TPA: gfo/Idh/MocA family oxidoreductase [Planctomycetaceae bacterium]|nr:gfo/Idh/MocA family oxidoreductase [Planctomycetaceae bacterium]
MNNTTRLSRRSFLRTTGASGLVGGLAAKSYAAVVGANERIRVGLIGGGVIAQSHVNAFNVLRKSGRFEPIAVADCWKTRAMQAVKKLDLPESRAVIDYRRILDNKEVDYVTVAAPEHQHGPMTLAALEAGKAVYCEKPMTRTIPEAQSVVRKQKETGLPVQVGIQGMSDDTYESAAQAIRDGVLGQVVQAQIDYVRRYGAQGPWRRPDLVERHVDKPADLDWNAWLGQTPNVPWDPRRYFEWQNFWDYSGGVSTGLFVHRITRIIKACDLSLPRRVVGMGGIWLWPDGRETPDNFEMLCEYPRGMTVYVLGTMGNRVGVDHLIRGHRGTMYFTGKGWVAKDKEGEVLAEHRSTGAEDILLHHMNLHHHLRNGEELHCPAELGLAGVAPVCMALDSWRTGRMMAWNEEKQEVVPADTAPFDPYLETKA